MLPHLSRYRNFLRLLYKHVNIIIGFQRFRYASLTTNLKLNFLLVLIFLIPIAKHFFFYKSDIQFNRLVVCYFLYTNSTIEVQLKYSSFLYCAVTPSSQYQRIVERSCFEIQNNILVSRTRL